MTSPFTKPSIAPGSRLFPHTHDRYVERLPRDQRFEVTWPAPLGPWKKGDVLERHVDLIGAHLQTLLAIGAVKTTTRPAYKSPETLNNLKIRAALSPRNGRALIEQAISAGLSVNAGGVLSATGPIAGAPSPTNKKVFVTPGEAP